MESNKLDKVFEDYGVKPVPDDKTRSWLSLGLMWAGVGISLGLLMTGGTIGNGLSFKQSITASIIGGIVLAIITALCGIVGANTRLSTAMVSRFTFGEKAVLLIAFIQAFGSFGWFGVQLGLFGETANAAANLAFGFTLNVTPLIIIGGIFMIITALFGYRSLDLLSKIAVPLLLILIVFSVFKIVEGSTLQEVLALKNSGASISMGAAISMVISSFIVGAVVAPDVSRYSRSAKDTIIAAVLAFAIVVPMVMIIGALMAQETGTSDLVQIMLRLGWGLLALFVMMLTQWSANDNNLYCAALGFAVVFKKLKQWKLTVIGGIIGLLLALLGIYDNFIPWLNTLGVLIPPMGGVIVADYYFINKKYYDFSYLSRIKDIRKESLFAWIIGSIVSFITSFTSFKLTTVSALDGLIVAGIVHYIILKTMLKNELPILNNETTLKG